MMSRMYYKRPPSIVITDEEEKRSATLESTIPTSREENIRRLVLVVDDRPYHWFSLVSDTINTVTIEEFRERVEEFFVVFDFSICDRDGLINTTADLRRSLRGSEAVITIVGDYAADASIDESPVRPGSPEPHPAPCMHVELTRKSEWEFFGLSNVIPRDRSGLVISRIDPRGLLSTHAPFVEVGDFISSVNGHYDVTSMRRELLISTHVDLTITKAVLFSS